MDSDVVSWLGDEKGEEGLDGVVHWFGRRRRVALLEGERSCLVGGRVGGILGV